MTSARPLGFLVCCRPELARRRWDRVSRARLGRLLFAACGLLALATPVAWAQSSPPQAGGSVPDPVLFQIQYDAKLPGHPLYSETLANVIYPIGKGPVDQGYPAEPLPVLVMVRGGNSNKFGVGELDIDNMIAQAPSMGAIGLSINMPILGSGDDYSKAAAGVKRLVQYLRHNAPNLNVDPDRVILIGRSLGLVVGYAVALQTDQQDLGSPDPVLHQSSRPNYYAPRFGPTALHCFDPTVGSWQQSLSILFFPGMAFEDSTEAERFNESPITWLMTPERYGREFTPPICINSFDPTSQPCGQVDDVHSGIFGRVSLQAIDDYARATDDWEWREKTGFIDISVTPAEIGIVNWAIERLAEDFDGLYMVPPIGSVLDGAPLSLNVAGGVPGASLAFFIGTASASSPISGCPNLEGLIDNAVLLGSATADVAGIATWQLPADPGVLGQTVLLRAVDLVNCEASNVVTHRYY